MKTIDSLDLELVTGGKAHPLTTIGGDTASSSSGNDQLLATLQGIQSSLEDLGKNQNGGLFGGNNALLFMTMALAFSRRNDVVVYGGGGYHHRGWSVRAWW
jgi:hypothetical protein